MYKNENVALADRAPYTTVALIKLANLIGTVVKDTSKSFIKAKTSNSQGLGSIFSDSSS